MSTDDIEKMMGRTKELWNLFRDGDSAFALQKIIERLNEEEEKYRVPSDFEIALNANRSKLSEVMEESCDAVRNDDDYQRVSEITRD